MREKKNKSGIVSIQIIDKSSGKYKMLETIGSSGQSSVVEGLKAKGHQRIWELTGLQKLNFDVGEEAALVEMFFNGITSMKLVGPELLLGKLFEEIGFDAIKDDLFRHLVIARLCYPASKLKTVDYLYKYQGIETEVDRIYRYLDKLHEKQKETIQQISYDHTCAVLGKQISIVFYDVTTLYFEAEQEDDLRKTGFSKDGKHQHPQIVLGLLVSEGGYPLAYDLFEGNKFEGHTMLPVVESFKEKYKLKTLVVVADSGLMSKANIEQLQAKGYSFIIGARIKNEPLLIQQKILGTKLSNGESVAVQKNEDIRIIISYSDARAKKDAHNRQRGLEKLQKKIKTGNLTKEHINNKGYNKYLVLKGAAKISIDENKFKDDGKWDGLKGYMTNTSLPKEEIITSYKHLWQIEKAFRISKTDLRIRPVFHHLRKRIESHICIAFCAYKIYKELERQLKMKDQSLSPEKAIEISKTICEIKIKTHLSETVHTRLYVDKEEQKNLIKIFNL